MSLVLSSKIKQLRKDKGLSLDQLSSITKISKSYLWELENRESNPTTEKLNILAKALEVTPGSLSDDEAELTDQVHKEAFFRKFDRLDPGDKEKISQIVELWSKKD